MSKIYSVLLTSAIQQVNYEFNNGVEYVLRHSFITGNMTYDREW